MTSLKKVLPLIVFSSLYASASQAQALDYQLDPTHTSVVVTWNHFGFSHPTASIPDSTGKLHFDPQHPEKASVNVQIPVSKIDTHVAALTKEFKNAEYFNTRQFPTATFQSTKVTATSKNAFDIEGKLTLKGITKTVTLHATLNQAGEHPIAKKQAVGFDATATLKRSEFNIDKYVPAVGNDITLTISTEAFAK